MINPIIQGEERRKLIEECIKLSKENTHLLIELPTSTGKGLIVANCIRESDSIKKWIVLCPEILQCVNYREDLKKFGNEDLLNSKIGDIICYASIDKLKGRSVNLAINEAHRVSEHRMDILKTVNFDQIVSDSATINKTVEERLTDIHPFYKYKRTLQEVIDLGILPEPQIICVGIDLNTIQRSEYNDLSKAVDSWKNRYERDAQEWQRIRWMTAGMKRKRWLSSIKTDKAREIIQSFGNERFICFSGSVAQSRELGGELAIDNKNSPKVNKEIINRFNELKTNSLFTCNMIREGQNLSDTSKGLIIQVDGEIRTTIQSIGRLLRAEDPRVYILYIRNTQDNNYVKKFIKESEINIEFL